MRRAAPCLGQRLPGLFQDEFLLLSRARSQQQIHHLTQFRHAQAFPPKAFQQVPLVAMGDIAQQKCPAFAQLK
jgi:hypothetical protein